VGMLNRCRSALSRRSLAWHDVSGPREGLSRFPRIVLDQQSSDGSKFLRNKILKEQGIKRFGKVGVSRSVHHGIPHLPDCEYAGLSEIVDALEIARREEKFVAKFFEVAGDRLVRDADLLSVPELVTVLNEHCLANYLNLRLMSKFKNELIYDSEKISSLMEIAVILNAFAHFNITSPKLLTAMMARGRVLVGEGDKSPESICLVVRSLCKCCKLGPKVGDFIGSLLEVLAQLEMEQLPVSDIALTLRILKERNFTKIPENLITKATLMVPTDIDSASN